MPSMHDVAILTTGTELTTGQVVNTNSSWLAEQLNDLFYNVVLQLSVPDDDALMIEALKFAHTQARIIFVCGGLGPTSDDKTRDVLGTFWQQKMIFYAPSWERIEKRINQAGFTVAESNKRQCWYPEGSTVIANQNGTADAFTYEDGSHKYFVLPGPPFELQSIWRQDLEAIFKNNSDRSQANHLTRWHLLGVSESAVAETVEKFVTEFDAAKGLTFGYRPHLPYLELKIWQPIHQLEQLQPCIKILRDRLGANVVAIDDDDVAKRFLLLCPRTPSLIIDPFSQGWLSQRLSSFIADTKPPLAVLAHYAQQLLPNDKDLRKHYAHVFSFTAPNDDGEWTMQLATAANVRQKTSRLPFRRVANQPGRERRYIAEFTLLAWSEMLQEKL